VEYQPRSARGYTVRGMKLIAMVVLILVPFLPLSALAHFPAIYGRDFVRMDRAVKVAPSHDEDNAPVSPIDPLAYKQALAELEALRGPYGAGLSEPLTMLALYHARRKDYGAATELYRRALHVLRINEGLADDALLPVLEKMLQMYERAGDFRALDLSYDQLYRVSNRALSTEDNDGKAATLRYFAWQRRAHALRLDASGNARLVALYADTRQQLDLALQREPVDRDWHWQLVMNQLHNLYLILGELRVVEQGALATQSGKEQLGARASPEYVRRRMINLQNTGAVLGNKLINEYLQRWPQISLVHKAEIQRELGDWNQWNQRQSSADKAYREAIANLLLAGEEQRLHRWFSEPVELPDTTVLNPRMPRDESRQPIRVNARFWVSKRGFVSDLKVDQVDPADSHRVGYLKRMLRDSHFRPRYLPDGSREVLSVERQYLLYH
jgi:hypothetical protein